MQCSNEKLLFFDEKLPVPILVWRCKILFFLLSSFFVCFLGPVPCFSNDAQLRPRVFYLIFRARCGCTSHFFLCAKNAKNIDYRKYWPCSTRITRICQVFFTHGRPNRGLAIAIASSQNLTTDHRPKPAAPRYLLPGLSALVVWIWPGD